MTAPTKPIREQNWLKTGPLLLASLSLHGLAMSVMLLFGDSASHGSGGSGPGGSDSAAATWIPGIGQSAAGKGAEVDTVVPDAEAGQSVEVTSPVEMPPQKSKPPLVTMLHTDPQRVFTESTEPLTVETEKAEFAEQQRIVTDAATSKTHRQKTDREVASIPNSSAVPSSSLNLESSQLSSSQAESHDSNDANDASDSHRQSTRGGNDGPGTGGAAGSGGSSATGGNRIEFFKIISRGKRVVYVIDASESMRRHDAMEIARKELWTSLQGLSTTAQFQIVFFNLTNHTISRPGERFKLLAATSSNLRLAKQFVTGIQPDSGTDRLAALTHALSLDPDVIYLLTDADAPELSARDLWEIHRNNKRKALIHVVEFGVGADMGSDSFLKKLCRQNAGMHYYRDLTKPEN